MTAPALILLAHGSSDATVVSTMHEVRKQMQVARPELSINLAFLDQCPPSGPQVVSALANRGVEEMVFVPLDLTRAVDPEPAALAMADRVRANFPNVSVAVSRPLGPATDLLNVLDATVRDALRRAHALELDALVLSTSANGDTRGASLVARRARQWAAHHKLPVAVSVADGSGPSSAQAVAILRGQGRRHIAVGSFFVAGDDSFQAQADAALEAGAIAVSAPMGAHQIVLDLIMSRYAFAAMELLDAQHRSEEESEPISIAQ